MAHGAPDDSNVVSTTTRMKETELMEVAARISGLASIDRSGRLHWYDNFEDGMGQWSVSLEEYGITGHLYTLWAKSGGYCVYGAWPISPYRLFQMSRWGVAPREPRVGLEASFGDSLGYDYCWLSLKVFKPTLNVQGGLRVKHVSKELQVLTGSSTWTTFATVPEYWAASGAWQTLKFTMDTDEPQYIRAIVGVEEYDLSAYQPYSYILVRWPWAQALVGAGNEVATAGNALFDDVILTYDEV